MGTEAAAAAFPSRRMTMYTSPVVVMMVEDEVDRNEVGGWLAGRMMGQS